MQRLTALYSSLLLHPPLFIHLANNYFMCTKYRHEHFDKESISLKTTKFIPVESDFDYRTYERTFSGRMTKARWKIIDSFCRAHSYHPRYRCGHDYDCCGCFCGQGMKFTYKHNQITVGFSQSFNY